MCVLSSFVGLQFICLVSRVSGSPDIQICAAVSIVNFRTFASPQEEAPYTDDVDINALFPTPTVAPGNHSSLFHLFGFAASAHYMQIEPYNMWFPPRLVFSTEHRVFKVHPCCSTCVSSSSLFMVESCSLMNRSHCFSFHLWARELLLPLLLLPLSHFSRVRPCATPSPGFFL